jgi:hypothetical protein
MRIMEIEEIYFLTVVTECRIFNSKCGEDIVTCQPAVGLRVRGCAAERY